VLNQVEKGKTNNLFLENISRAFSLPDNITKDLKTNGMAIHPVPNLPGEKLVSLAGKD
jgi:hypothetical protein